MGKVYKGYELMKAIAEGKIKENQQLDFSKLDNEDYRKVYWDGYNLKYKDTETNVLEYISDSEFAHGKFELLKDEVIDIPEIEEIKTLGCNIETNNGMIIPTENLVCDCIINKINEIIKAVNKMQLDNKTKEK